MNRFGVMGEVALDRDGVLHGWCWSPDRPAARLTVEILVDGAAAASVIASRFREDVRNRKFGDGYHGFTITLTKHLAARPALVQAREPVSGQVFWQKSFASFGIPPDYDTRLAALPGRIGAAARGLTRPSNQSHLRAGLVAAGQMLLGTKFPGQTGPAIRLPQLTAPVFSVILNTGGDADATFAVVAAAAPVFGHIGAELILIDDGADPRGLFLAGRIVGAGYVFGAGEGAAALRNAAATAARGEILLFIRADAASFGIGLGLGLQSVPATPGVMAGASVAQRAARLLPDAATRLVLAPIRPFLGLDLAIPRAVFAAAGGFDEAADGPEAALLARCLDFGDATLWREPRLPGMPGTDDAGPLP